MRCMVRSRLGWYARDAGGQPRWAPTVMDATVFSSLKIGRGVVRLLAQNRIKAVVVPMGKKGGDR